MRIKIMKRAFLVLLCCLSCTGGFLTALLFGIPGNFSLYLDSALPQNLLYSIEMSELPCGVAATEAESGVCTRPASAMLFGIFPLKSVSVTYYDQRTLLACGTSFGVRVKTQGVVVAQTAAFLSGGVEVDPAAEADIQKGDILLRVNGKILVGVEMLTTLLQKEQTNEVTVLVRRGGIEKETVLRPRIADEDGKVRAGIWVRDCMAGIGTMTYVDPVSGAFGGLGHGVCDVGSEELLPISGGEAYGVRLSGVQKGEAGAPGELQGSFGEKQIGSVERNTECGVFGVLKELPGASAQAYEIGFKEELRLGEAQILATVEEGNTECYTVEILRVCDPYSATKNFLIQVTDERLLSKTGGIVQGMSGSPILQNGKFCGALTHVLVNDPTKGYGIYLENMLRAAA